MFLREAKQEYSKDDRGIMIIWTMTAIGGFCVGLATGIIFMLLREAKQE
jgi:hypothetical protein